MFCSIETGQVGSFSLCWNKIFFLCIVFKRVRRETLETQVKAAEITKEFRIFSLESVWTLTCGLAVAVAFLSSAPWDFPWVVKMLCYRRNVEFISCLYFFMFLSIFFSLIFMSVSLHLFNTFIISEYFNSLYYSSWSCFQFTQKQQLNIPILSCSLVAVLVSKWNADKNSVD